MELTQAEYEQIAESLPKQRGNVQNENLQVRNAILSVAGQECKWRGLPAHFGKWHPVEMRMNRWSKSGVIQRVLEELQRAQMVRIKVAAGSLDRTMIKVHPDGARGLEKNGPQVIGKCRAGWSTKIHLVAANAACAPTFSLSPGPDGAGPSGRELLRAWKKPDAVCHLIMDRASEGEATRPLALDLGMNPVVPPKSNRLIPWDYDKALSQKRQEVARLFRRLKGFRRSFSRFEKLDVLLTGFIHFVLIAEALR